MPNPVLGGVEMGKIIKVNMVEGKIVIEDVPTEYISLGGRCLTSRILLDEVDHACHPLGHNNKIIFAPGLLAGTYAPCYDRLSVGAKSPLTEGIKESNSGGTAARAMAQLGIKALIIEGEPKKDGWYVLKLDKEGINLLPAANLVGLGNFAVMEKIKASYGKNVSVICIGQAGEMLLSAAAIAVSDMHNRPGAFAARGGLGAVMGSKRIKAILIDAPGTEKTSYHDENAFRGISKELSKELIETKKLLTEYGSLFLMNIVQREGCRPTRNYRRGQFEDHDKMTPETYAGLTTRRKGRMSDTCTPGCPIRCKSIYNDKDGKFLTTTIQFETAILLGSNCEVADWDVMAYMNRLCNDYGVDTIDVGSAIGVAMEGGLLKFGDSQRAIELITEIGKGTPLGRIIGSGCYITGKVFGVRRVPVVKKQALSGYDPRGLKGTGVTFATSPMGADHTCGNALPGRGAITPNLNLDIRDGTDKAKLSQELQILTASGDGLGLCFLAGHDLHMIEVSADLLSAKTGATISREDILAMGRETLKVEREFNRRAGFTEVDDRLPHFFNQEKLPPHNTIFDIPDGELSESNA